MTTARRLGRIPPYLFAEIDRKIQAKKAAGVDVISLGIGDPDLPTPPRIVSALQEAATDPANHRYPSYVGLRELRGSIADWYSGRFDVRLDPDSEILPTLGSKDGISHAPFAFVDPGEVVLAPDPGYTPYATGAIMADGEPYMLPLTAANAWLPDLGSVPADIRRRAKLLWLNYPNNPTAAVAPAEFFAEAIRFCSANGVILCHDAPYTEIAFEGYRPPSLLQFPGGKEIGIEFHSVSKTYNMTGWRLGWSVKPPKATFYVWAPVPKGYDSISFAGHVLDQVGVNITPGVGFGPHGEGYFRLSVTAPDARLDEALDRLRTLRV
ncbi:MAG: aminotransferase class I/II-fold pyridoxal phosphate-dependent enzyme [Chloroflexi bacterium]|nr:MAG: aminotransferase class I/II-fold pyridoxal phosphate-dependent enzyme [Chloroflexota bacterium]